MSKLYAALWLALLAPDAAYREGIERWRRDVEQSLKADDGWLTVAGLFWLKEGVNRIGAGAGNPIELPAGSAPARVGSIRFHSGKAELQLDPGVNALLNGKPVRSAVLRSDSPGPPDTLTIGDVSLYVIERGGRFGVRLKDKNSRFRKNFTGRTWFPVKEEYRIKARFEPYRPAKQITVPNVLGQTEKMDCPGRAVFRWQGQEVSLEPVTAGKQLWFIFKDRTSGKETYPAGRFLYAPAAVDDKIELDFNRAYNPPCAFTPYATCPLPPRQNWLPVRIEAGELTYHAE